MQERYCPQDIETKWQRRWAEEGLYRTSEDASRPKWYALTMFVYPSGDLHAGHWYAFSPSDAAARYRRMCGYNVFFPPGFDAFGLPAENAAIKRGIHPHEWTYGNIHHMRQQLGRMGAMWAWDHEAVTCDPDYYKWTQWFFLKFYDAGLAYRDLAPVDWCPSCNTTLAREQVWGDDRHCERCRTPVVKKELEQWRLRITRYADELLNFDGCDWPERVKVMQANWIGRSEGALITFATEAGDAIDVFTTRPETLWGATFLVVAPEHPLVGRLTVPEHEREVADYQLAASRLEEISRMSQTKARTGVFTGSYARNPATGELMPVWMADYVMMGYGTGAIMAVPGHDQRDYDFARTFDLRIRRVITGPDGNTGDLPQAWPGSEDDNLMNSGSFDGTRVGESAAIVTDWLEASGKGRSEVSYRMRDWVVSRQRMWGAPIPIIYCATCGTVPVPYEDLPVMLPEAAQFQPTGESPLKTCDAFRHVRCPRCGKDAERETDTLDTFVCSSWYQYAYISPYHMRGESLHADSLPWDRPSGDYWLPVDQYTGGIEHATMHLLYTRFFTKAMRDIGLVTFDEPMHRLYNQGMILGPDGEKMSKSRGNVVNPDEMVNRYGADTVRGYMMFIGPWDQGGPWDPGAIEGISRFLSRVWSTVFDEPSCGEQFAETNEDEVKEIERRMHQAIIKISEDFERFRFNTAIAKLMEFNSVMTRAKSPCVVKSREWDQAMTAMLLLMAPIFPHIAEEMWHRRGNEESIHLQKWPRGDTTKARDDETIVALQVNGKIRDRVAVAVGTDSDTLERIALESEGIQKWIHGKHVQKVIVVPDKLVNVVVR